MGERGQREKEEEEASRDKGKCSEKGKKRDRG
jgi:hypothetical protein